MDRGREREIVSQSAKYVAMSSLVPRSSPQFDHTKSRKCPDPILIQRFLLQNTDFAGEINVEDRICFACYKAHLVIIKHTSNSTDQDLSSLIDKLKTELEDEGEISTQDQAVLHAVHRSAILVGETLLAILLPQVF